MNHRVQEKTKLAERKLHLQQNLIQDCEWMWIFLCKKHNNERDTWTIKSHGNRQWNLSISSFSVSLSLLASSPFYHRETRQKVPQQTLAWVTKVTSSFSQWLQERQEVYNTILMGFLEATHYCDNDHQKWDQQEEEEEEDAMKHKRHSQDMKWNSIHLSKTMEMRKGDEKRRLEQQREDLKFNLKESYLAMNV